MLTDIVSKLGQFVPIIGICAVFYFMVFRPQQKKAQEHQIFLSGLKVGDRVLTSSGMVVIIRTIPSQGNMIGVSFGESLDLLWCLKSSLAGAFTDSIPDHSEKKLSSESKKKKILSKSDDSSVHES